MICVPLLLCGCASAPRVGLPAVVAPPSLEATGQDLVWMRSDGQKVAGNFTREQQFFQAQYECTNNSVQPPLVSEDCMRGKGYVYVPRPTG